ncbi:uncharacterized protein LOC108485015 [Gossypium arboreum]|uniref:uncharacterized protein LOC108485015 n=1 Tax=Gossypium arboreum TaxID=29729 RepID=UPI0008190141|nr:uncharacterized protein LOC108485015 [Gossypium arboreum]
MQKIKLEDEGMQFIEQERILNEKIKVVVKKEIIKWLDAGIIYPIADSTWVSPVQCVPKKSGITVVTNNKDELILTRIPTGWLARKAYYCFLDGYSGYNQIAIAPEDQEKTTFTYPFSIFAFR